MLIMGVADVATWLAIMSLRGTAESWVHIPPQTAGWVVVNLPIAPEGVDFLSGHPGRLLGATQYGDSRSSEGELLISLYARGVSPFMVTRRSFREPTNESTARCWVTRSSQTAVVPTFQFTPT